MFVLYEADEWMTRQRGLITFCLIYGAVSEVRDPDRDEGGAASDKLYEMLSPHKMRG